MPTKRPTKKSRHSKRSFTNGRSRSQRPPSFDSGIIPEPLLAFGGQHHHVDPKTGLALYGPYSLKGQREPPLTSIKVGIVGPPAMVADAEQWLNACQGMMTNDGSVPFLYPHFPGFNREHPFQCDLMFGETWNETIPNLDPILKVLNFYERIKQVVKQYVGAIEVLAGRQPSPDVIMCCIPQDVIDLCTVKISKTGEVRRIKRSPAEKKALKKAQIPLFKEMDPTMGVEGEEEGHENLRRGLKAEVMQYNIPTQLVWPRTLKLIDDKDNSRKNRSQDVATRSWNFTTGLYHKAGGSPWRLTEIDPSVCFVGISFFREILEQNPMMRTSMAQAFTAAGDGYVLRGNSFEWNESMGASPHLDSNGAASLIRDVLDLYKRQNRESLPSRIVVHKSSRFWDDELAGFKDACEIVPRKDFVALGGRDIQFYRTGDYPPVRGTFVKFSDTNFLLYTNGYIPYLRTYPGARVPKPLEILEHHGDSPWNTILQEIMALTKMNWNTADFSCSVPVTIAFSRRIGEILAELPEGCPINQEYRFYM